MRRLFFSICFLYGALAKGQQTIDISVNYTNTDASLEEIFEDLEVQYGIRFSYATSSWKQQKMDANFTGESIENVLDYLLLDQSLEYKIVEKNILVRKAEGYSTVDNEAYQESIHIQGKVASDLDENLSFATVSIKGSSIGTFTDVDGTFDLEIPENKMDGTLSISYVGYSPMEYKISQLNNAYLLVGLSQEPYYVDGIQIVNKKKPISIQPFSKSISLNSTQIESNTSGILGNDIGRSVQMLPGITAHDDDSAEIKIRGSNSDATLMVLDGMPIYSASHYYGIFSSVNAKFIDSVNIYKNAYPIYYGGKTGGLVELFSDKSIPKKAEGSLDIDLMTTSAYLNTPLSKNMALKIAGRTTLRSINNNQFNTVTSNRLENFMVQNFGQKIDNRKSDPDFKFFDLNGTFLWKPSAKSSLLVHVFRSGDRLENRYNFKVNDNNENEVRLVVDEDRKWSNSSSSVNWKQQINQFWNWNASGYYSSYESDESVNIDLNKKHKNGSSPPKIFNPDGALLSANKFNYLKDRGIDTHVQFEKNNRVFQLGVFGTNQNVSYEFRENKEMNFFGDRIIKSVGGYTSYQQKFSNKFLVDVGLRTNYYNTLSKAYLSPRINLAYQPNDRFTLKGSVYQENQVIRQFYYEYRSVPSEMWVAANNDNIPVLQSQNSMIGFTFQSSIFSLDVEGYYKSLNGVLEYVLLNPLDAENNPQKASDYRLFNGEGRIYGLDVIVSTGYKNYDTYLSYTLSKNEERYNEIYKNRYYASENDRRHQFKWVNTLSAGNWTFGANIIYSSGRPYTNVGNNEDIRESDPDKRLRLLPAYFRTDASIDYTFKLKNYNASLGISVFNLTNTQNVKYVQSINTQLQNGQAPINTVIGNESSLLDRTVNVIGRFWF